MPSSTDIIHRYNIYFVDALSFNPSLSPYSPIRCSSRKQSDYVLLAPTTDGYKLRAYYVDK
ncbi:hypothetical protein NXW94_30260 [Bacteroides ovatus]|nr:hypothetical protein [Bacteroides ovatus]